MAQSLRGATSRAETQEMTRMGLLGDFRFIWPFYAAGLTGYLLGAIPFGLLLTRFAGLGDIRAIGSGNIGATNVLRTGRKGLAAATLLLDGGKGAAAALIAGHWGPEMALWAGIGAVLGHVFPVWLSFKGGKGIATILGVLLATYWPMGLGFAVCWIVVAGAFRYSSLASLIAGLSMPITAFFFARRESIWWAASLTLLILYTHRANIGRLLRGEESKIGRNRKTP